MCGCHVWLSCCTRIRRPAELRPSMACALAKFALGQAQVITAHRAQVKGSSPALLASLHCGAVGMPHLSALSNMKPEMYMHPVQEIAAVPAMQQPSHVLPRTLANMVAFSAIGVKLAYMAQLLFDDMHVLL